jgi:hypothetical protein
MNKDAATPLTPDEFASLEAFTLVRTQRDVPGSHKLKLVRLGLLEEVLGGFQPTNAGRKRIAKKK